MTIRMKGTKMKKTKITKLICSLVLFAAAFTACSSDTAEAESAKIVIWGTVYSNGELIETESCALTFLDYGTMETVYLCEQINCDHSDYVTEDELPCFAYGKEILPVLYGGRLYWLRDSSTVSGGKLQNSLTLMSSEPFGLAEKEICKINGLTLDFSSSAYMKNGVLYFFPYEQETDENNVVTDNFSYHLAVLELSSGKFTDLGAQGTKEPSIKGFYDNKFYFDDNVCDTKNKSVSANETPHNSGETVISDDYYAYNSGENIEILCSGGKDKKTILSDAIDMESVIVDHRLFISKNSGTEWYYYDLTEEAPAKHNITADLGWAQVIAQYEDDYILNVFNPEEQSVSKVKVPKSEIFGA